MAVVAVDRPICSLCCDGVQCGPGRLHGRMHATHDRAHSLKAFWPVQNQMKTLFDPPCAAMGSHSATEHS